jgi:hypothetical protein
MMESQSTPSPPTNVASFSLEAPRELADHTTENPKTLLGLLQRAARIWPTHGITLKDQGWDQVSDFLTYADLLRQAEASVIIIRAKRDLLT